MNQVITGFESSAAFGVFWPTWLAIAGACMFCLLGLYSALLFFADKQLLERFRFLLPVTLRSRILHGILFAATLPAISLALVLMERVTNERLDRTANLMMSQTGGVAQLADFFLYRSVAKINAAAAELNDESTWLSQQQLRDLQAASPELLSLVLVATNGQVLTATGSGPNAPQLLSVDQDYLAAPLKFGESFVSGFHRVSSTVASHAVAISAPVTDRSGRISGALVGFLNLDSFQRLNQPFLAKKNIESVVIDDNGRVLFSSERSGHAVGEDLNGSTLLAPPYAGDQTLFRFAESGEAVSNTSYLAVGHTLGNGWRVYLYRSLDSVRNAMLGDYGVALAWLGAAMIISLCLALAMVSGISGPLESLDRQVREFDLKKPRQRPQAPPGAPLEVRSIFRHLGALDRRVRSAYSKLHRALVQGEKLRGELIYVISNREKEIEARTEELKKANETLERLSREDSLTGLANRRWFAQFLAQTWRTALRDNKAISILIMDIDDFKAYNDTYGHQKGDACLRSVADAIRRSVGRASDMVSRYGGEEFVAVLGDTPLEGALQIAEQIRAAVEALQIPHSSAKYHQTVTLSIGVTSTLPTHDTQPETVLIAADRAMYNAKHEGKNRVAYSTAARTGTYQALTMPSDTSKRLS